MLKNHTYLGILSKLNDKWICEFGLHVLRVHYFLTSVPVAPIIDDLQIHCNDDDKIMSLVDIRWTVSFCNHWYHFTVWLMHIPHVSPNYLT